MTTPNLQLTEVTLADTPAAASLNDSFRSLDSTVQLAILSQDIATPPADAIQGDRYIIPLAATGAWTGRTNHVAYRDPAGWSFRIPRPGWRAWSIPEETMLVFNGTEWTEFAGGGGGGGGGDSGLAFSQTRVDTADEVVNTAAETNFFNDYEINGGILGAAGRTCEARFFGVLSTDGGAAPNIRFRVKLGSTVVLDSGDVTLPTGMADAGWMIDAIILRTNLANFVEAQGQLRIAGVDSVGMANTAPIGVTLTSDQVLRLSADWSAADVDNSATMRAMTVRIDQAASVTDAGVPALIRTNMFGGRTGASPSSTFTPPDNCLLVAVVGVCETGGVTDPSADIGISGGGLTWTPVLTIGDSASYSRGVRIFTAPVITGASMAVTGSLGGGRPLYTLDIHVFAYENVDTGSPIGATASSNTIAGGSGPQTLTLSAAPAVTSEVLAVMHTSPTSSSSPISPTSPWVEQYDNGGGSIQMQTQTRAADTSTLVSWSGVGATFFNTNLAAAIEIKNN